MYVYKKKCGKLDHQLNCTGDITVNSLLHIAIDRKYDPNTEKKIDVTKKTVGTVVLNFKRNGRRIDDTMYGVQDFHASNLCTNIHAKTKR